ncbi:unnamed protein product [Moneuplotes crassus]|uniref:Uncharacterized protein n=1 Tax=Euplotes crassus TaxID=5936 RepID=A0AAD1UIN0_EUPCR|nr:unnamed protein product [Moneuplotes crassus]
MTSIIMNNNVCMKKIKIIEIFSIVFIFRNIILYGTLTDIFEYKCICTRRIIHQILISNMYQ